MLERRCTGLPLEHVLGWAFFCGLRISVAPGVFVPRRRTGFLVRQAAALVAPRHSPTVVVDLCCGSGAVGVAIAAALGGVELHAVDIDPSQSAAPRQTCAPWVGTRTRATSMDRSRRACVVASTC
jgi:release factor glutamine methyltransferase